jgi:histidinol-phosphate aminotransferase
VLPTELSRRDFARAAGAGVAAAVVGRALPVRASVPGRPIILDSNENPYGPSPKALEAMTASQRVAARYPDALEQKVADAVAKRHGVEPERVILGCGSGEVLRMADMAFLGPGRKVVVSHPTFEAVIGYAEVIKGEAVTVPQTADYRHDLPRMAAACDASVGLVYVCNPNNPTATFVTRDELLAFLERVPAATKVVVDEAYFHFADDARYASADQWLGRFPNLLVVRTFSKVFGLAGMRLGYAVGSAEAIAAMQRHRVYSNGNAAVLEAALASLGDSAHVEEQRRRNARTRSWLYAELTKDGRRYIPSQANFVMIGIGSDVKPVIQAFRDRGIMVGRRFPSMEDWLRITIGTPEEMRAFVAALREIVPARGGRAA